MSTAYIYLDESGEFQTTDTQCLIAGFTYIAKDEEAPDAHRRALSQLMRSAAAKWGVAYPGGLHTTRNDTLKALVRRDFAQITRSLFRRGEYEPFVCYCLPNHLPEDVQKREHIAEGLYRHMLQQLLRHVIARLPGDVAAVNLFIPTRIAPVAEDQKATMEKAGVFSDPTVPGSIALYELNASGVHLFTRDELLKITDAQIDVSVDHVEYHSDEDDCQAGYRFADWICCLCTGYCWLQRVATPGRVALSVFTEPLREIFRREAHVVCFGPDYDLLVRGLESAASPCPIEYLNAVTAFEQPERAHLAPYRDMLLAKNPFANPQIIRAVDDHLFFGYYIQARYREAKPLYAAMLDMAQRAGAEDTALLGIKTKLMCCLQHTGEADKANALFSACYALPMPAIARLDLLNKYVQTLLDVLSFDKARAYIDAAMETYHQSPRLSLPFTADAPPEDPELALMLSKCRSTRGQISGFLCTDDGYAWFDSALSGFAPGSANYAITLGHRLHYALSRGDWAEFGRHAGEYFCGEAGDYTDPGTWMWWYGALLARCEEGVQQERPDTSSRFALLIFYKALYLYLSQLQSGQALDPAFRHTMCDLLFSDERLFDLFDRLDAPDHPFELIYKYVALLARLCDPQDGSAQSNAVWKVIDACTSRLEALQKTSVGTVALIVQIGLCQLSVRVQGKKQLAQRSAALQRLMSALHDEWQPIRSGETSPLLSRLLAQYNAKKPEENDYASFLPYEYA